MILLKFTVKALLATVIWLQPSQAVISSISTANTTVGFPVVTILGRAVSSSVYVCTTTTTDTLPTITIIGRAVTPLASLCTTTITVDVSPVTVTASPVTVGNPSTTPDVRPLFSYYFLLLKNCGIFKGRVLVAPLHQYDFRGQGQYFLVQYTFH